jgi:serine/threonine-protein kinase
MSIQSAEADLTGRELGDYCVLRRIGAGGMAEVYLAEQQSLGRSVALKVLNAGLARDRAYVDRFQREARAAASLVHANIVQIYEVGQTDGVHFIAQEYIRGKNLAEVLARQAALEPRLVLDVLRQVAAALCRAAELGIVHRDLKPENIMLCPSGEVKVADFGLARAGSSDAKTLTEVGVAMGTPMYMSPEQIEGRPVDARSDIYSLGVTSYHLLTGAPPHTGDTALAIALHHLNSLPRPLENVRGDIPSGLARVVHRMIAKRPEHRYQGPGELLADLRKLAGEAAAEGWGESADAWSLAEWMASTAPQSPAAAELGRLMHTSAKLSAPARSPLRLAAIVVGSMALGALAAWATWPQSYLDGPRAAEVVQRDSAWAQLFHAKMAPSEAAWEAVWKYFPDEDAYIHDLAREGLVRYHLELSQDPQNYQRARRLLLEWIPTLDAQSPQRAFASAALVVANARLGRREEARVAASQVTSEMRDFLRRSDDRIYEPLQSALRQLGD